MTERHRRATVEGLRHVLHAESVALVGVSTRSGSVGATVLENILAGGYRGTLHVVHPRVAEVHGVATVPRVHDLPAGADRRKTPWPVGWLE